MATYFHAPSALLIAGGVADDMSALSTGRQHDLHRDGVVGRRRHDRSIMTALGIGPRDLSPAVGTPIQKRQASQA
jgi:hypothetical protein